MSTDWTDPSLKYSLPAQLTPTVHRKVPDELQPETDQQREAARGKIVVITGGGTGIGAAIARVWIRAGAEGVVIAGRRQDALENTLLSLTKLNTGCTRTSAFSADVTKEDDVVNLFEHVQRTFGRTADVVFANAGLMLESKPLAEEKITSWWRTHEINVLGVHTTTVAWIRSQPDPKKPTGTIININTGLSAMTVAGTSAYVTSKLAAHRYMEFVQAGNVISYVLVLMKPSFADVQQTEYPTLRTFSLIPGIVSSDMSEMGPFAMYAKDEAEQAGAMGLYLASSCGDYLKGCLANVNWDVAETEAREDEIKAGLLKLKWIGLPASTDEQR